MARRTHRSPLPLLELALSLVKYTYPVTGSTTGLLLMGPLMGNMKFGRPFVALIANIKRDLTKAVTPPTFTAYNI